MLASPPAAACRSTCAWMARLANELSGWNRVGAVIALDRQQRSARLQSPGDGAERGARVGEVLEHEADERRIERPFGERQGEDVGFEKFDVCQPGALHRDFGAGERGGVDIDGDKPRQRTAARQFDGLRADAASRFKHARAPGKAQSAVQQLGERRSLILESDAFLLAVTVDIRIAHRCAARLGTVGTVPQPARKVLNAIADSAQPARRDRELTYARARHMRLIGKSASDGSLGEIGAGEDAYRRASRARAWRA